MRGLWLENGTWQLREDLPMPVPLPGEALVRVLLTGICATDLALARGYYPFTGIPGHEFVGEVVRSTGRPDLEGYRVVGEINSACGDCGECRAGRSRHCDRRRVLGIRNMAGALAEYLVLPEEQLLKVPEKVSTEHAVFTEPLAAALAITRQAVIGTEDRLLVIGAGRLGQLIARTLALSGSLPVVVVRHARHEALLHGKGITTVNEHDVAARSFDVVVEASGSASGFELALHAIRPMGQVILKSTFPGTVAVNLSQLVVDEIRLTGSRCGPFGPVLRLLEGGYIDPSELIDDIYPLTQGIAALERAAMPGSLKIVVKP